MSQQKGGSFVRDKLAGDVLVSPHSCYRYVRGRELLLLFERILVISREKLFRLTSITLGTLHLRATSLSLSRASTFQTRRRERRRKEGGKKSDVLCCFRALPQNSGKSIDSMLSKRSELGLRDRTAEERAGKGGSSPFLRVFKPESSVESANSAGGRIRVARGRPPSSAFRYFGWEGRGVGSSLEEEEEEEGGRPCTRV